MFVIPLINRLHLCFWLTLEELVPELFPPKSTLDDLREENSALRQELGKCQDALVERGKALRYQDQRHCLDQQGWHNKFDVMLDAINTRDDRIRSLEEDVAKFKALAATDPLTGLLNQRGAEKELERALNRFERNDYGHLEDQLHGMSCIVVDVDDFKWINDNLGHDAGDGVLQTIAQHLEDSFRPEDLVIRWGGDEFLIYLLGAGREGALRRAQELATKLSHDWRLAFDEGRRHVTLSIGVCHGSFRTRRGGTALAKDIKRRADEVMYTAKESSPAGTSGIVEVTETIFNDTQL